MKGETAFSTEHQNEIELLALEISELKNVLRELSQQVLRIERRIRSVLPNSEARSVLGRVDHNGDYFARNVINRLTESAKEGNQIENELRHMTVKQELSKVAKELGMTNTKLPPKDVLIRRISTRIRQRASVTSSIRDSIHE